MFAEPDRLSPQSLATYFPDLERRLGGMLAQLPSNDTLLAATLAAGRAVLGEAAVQELPRTDARIDRAPALAEIGGDPRPHLRRFPALLRNLEELDQAAEGRGILSLAPELDGVVRRVPAVALVAGSVRPVLTIEMLRLATGGGALGVRVDKAGIAGLVIAGIGVLSDRDGQPWVRYAPRDARRVLSAVDLVRGTVPVERLANRLLLFGTSATGLGDLKTVPLGANFPGVEVHAQLLETILSQRYLLRPHVAVAQELLAVALAGLLLIGLFPVVGPRLSLLVLATVLTALFGGSWLLFEQQSPLLDATFPGAAAVLLYGGLAYAGYRSAERRRREVRTAFSQYVSPVLVERLAENPDGLKLGGELRPMTVMFADVRGFTTISEQFRDDPSGLTQLINRFLTPMSEAVLATNGTIDKYIGDCLMAFWNAPLDDPDHAGHACSATLDMFERLGRLNAELRRETLGDAAAHEEYVLAKRLSAGQGLSRDAAKAFELLCQEAERGFANAPYSLGKAYRDGQGVAADPVAAARWFEAAAEQGYAKAQRHIGVRYARGEGVSPDLVRALTWLTIAARQGLRTAEELREELLAGAAAGQIAEAERQARLFRPSAQKRAVHLEMGIGLSTRPCVVGNMGSTQRFDYSVLGDTVNLASRLGAQSKNYGVGIVLGEATRIAAPAFAALELDLLAVKGRNRAEPIYGLLGDAALAESAAFRELTRAHEAMLQAYRAQDWGEARAALRLAATRGEELEYLYELYRRRLDHYEADPPGPGWDGVFVAHSK
ncbi:MAG: CHASE2 domain-containing protein [Alphaproteobacteria bacterium]|nr:CHASE2 domain-containing protein [Alphaproteobacteria bacterium]